MVNPVYGEGVRESKRGQALEGNARNQRTVEALDRN